MTSPNCQNFDTCGCPICPIDEQSLEFGVWYPDEEVCKTQAHNKHRWIAAQRKIARKTQDTHRYFTLEMLKRHCVIGRGMKGLTPDTDEGPQLAKWMRAHPVKHISEAQRVAGRNAGRAAVKAGRIGKK